MEWLNEYSGLFSLVAAIAAIVLPYRIYYKQKRDRQQELEDEYNSIEDTTIFPMSVEDRKFFARRDFLKKQLKK